jgi:CBS domain-containing protein
MIMQDILSLKGSTVYRVSPERTVAEAVGMLVEHKIGALLVCDDHDSEEHLVGVISERDLLLAHAGLKGPAGSGKRVAGECRWMDCKVAELMSTDVVTAAPGDSVGQVMGLMTSRRIRHLPILDQRRVVGIVSIGDVVKAQHDRLAVENRYLQDYIRG